MSPYGVIDHSLPLVRTRDVQVLIGRPVPLPDNPPYRLLPLPIKDVGDHYACPLTSQIDGHGWRLGRGQRQR